eukprot:6113262-Lingulodinium_polyedra.AAC.1
MSVHTHSKIWYKHRLLDHLSLMNMMGWTPRDSFVVPFDVDAKAMQKIIGNMVATPTAGAAVAILLSSSFLDAAAIQPDAELDAKGER